MWRYLFSVLFLCTVFGLSAQSINTAFGKNRVQFHDDFNNWWQYESTNFVTYWYGKARNVAEPTILMAEMDHDAIQRVLEHRINDKIEIIVYLDISDLKQSNIGTEETFSNKTGETKIVGNKMFVYFDGNHQHLRQKINEGIATVYLNNMLFGSNLQEIIQNAVLLNIPEWYHDGIIAYAASPWNAQSEEELRDLWHNDKDNRDFKKLSAEHPRIAGHSMWFFIDQYYGKSTISNLLYLTKISRGMENSFEYILNTDLKTLEKEWSGFYTEYFDAEKGKYENHSGAKDLKISGRNKIPVSTMSLSPDGQQLAYVTNDQGKVSIYLHDFKTGKEKRIFKYGYKNVFQETDYNYPMVTWHPDGHELTILYERRDVIKLVKYRMDTGEKMEQIVPTEFQRIYSVSYVDDWDYIFSASVDGWGDLFRYKSKRRIQERITNDFYDDLDASYISYKGKKGILFTSNRPNEVIKQMKFDTILPLGTFDVFFLPDGENMAERLTNTPYSNDRKPLIYKDNQIICLGDQTGVVNTYVIKEEGKLYALSNLDRNITGHSLTSGSDVYLKTFRKNGRYRVSKEKINTELAVAPVPTMSGLSMNVQPLPAAIAEKNELKAEQNKEVEEGFKFQTPFGDPPVIEPIKVRQPDKKSVKDFSIQINRPYIPSKPLEPFDNIRAIAANNKFAITNVTTKMDNDLLFDGLESYTGDRQQLLTTPLGILLKAEIQDLFEDHQIEAGVRIPTSFSGSEVFLVYDNKKQRIDKKYALYRKSTRYNNDIPLGSNLLSRSKKTTLLGLYQLKYPFDIYRSVRATGSLRIDRYMQLSTEQRSFSAPLVSEKRASIKLEYVYDNTHDEALNIKHGTRYKFFTEFINRFDLQLIDGVTFNPSLGFTGIVGFDARHYIPVLGKSLIALRTAGATSFGSEKMLYFLGGVENWFFPSFNENIQVPDHSDYAYKANVFQMRGFNNNIRNGSTFVVANVELRIPFMQYILGSNRGSAFFRNMQLVGFFDTGLAWHGSGPFSDKNILNVVNISTPPLIDMTIEYFRDPLVAGFGAGLRTQILGYFVKADYGWGIETRVIQKPRFYLSFGMDF